jgi:ParB/RepB/Spo0J family partition protein
VSEFKFIPVINLCESPTNPRRSYNETALQELSQSIKEKGILQPILVRPHAGKGKKKAITHEIVAGSRRFRASQLAGLEEVPCIVRDLDDNQVLECQVIENLQREDVHPLEEADGYAKLIDRGIYDVASIAEKVGKSEAYVYGRMKLLSLSERTRKMFDEDHISLGTAQILSRLQPQDQDEVLESNRWEVSNGAFKPSKAEEWIRNNILLKVSGFPFKASDSDLLPVAGPCTTCAKNTAIQPLLFPDEKGNKSGLCTDRRCHAEKLGAYESRLVEDLKAKTGVEEIAILSENWHYCRESTIPHGKWSFASEDAEGAKLGLIVEGHKPYSTIFYTDRNDSECGRAQQTPEQRAEDREKARLIKVEMLTRRRIFDAIDIVLQTWTPHTVSVLNDSLPCLIATFAAKLATQQREVYESKDREDSRHPGFGAALEELGHTDGLYRTIKAEKLIGIPLQSAIRGAFIAATRDEIHQHKAELNSGHVDSPGIALFTFARILAIDIAGIRKASDWDLLSKKAQKERLRAEKAGGKDA